jgi:hypothetical protein
VVYLLLVLMPAMAVAPRVCRLNVLALLVVAGCGLQEPASRAQRTEEALADRPAHADPDRGYSISFPGSWQLASERMSRISEPRELVSIGTTALGWRPTDCEAFAGAAGAGMGARDVVLTVWERGYDRDPGWVDFPSRPDRFGPVPHAERAGRGCGEPSGTVIHWRNFSDSGRHFHTLVRIGPDAPASAAAQAWRILDSLRLDPDYQPSWPASG